MKRTDKPSLIQTPSGITPQDARWVTGITFVVISVLWIFFSVEEPLHIDELRQLAGYGGGFGTWIAKSWELNQPPLEIVLGGLWRTAFGATDFAERLLPTLFGLGSLALIGRLAVVFSSSAFAAPIAILAYGLSPVILPTTAFIRPYAIPTFFALLYIIAVRRLLEKGARAGTVAFAGIAGLGLLATHALVPTVVAIAVLAALVGRRLLTRRPDVGTAPALAISAAVALLSLVAPVITRLKNPSFFDVRVEYSIGQRITDAIDAVWTSYSGAFGLAGIALLLVLLLLFTKTFRPAQGEVWWFVPLVAISPGITAVFLATVAPGFSFFDRYFHDLLLPGALAAGLVGSRLVTTRWRNTRSRIPLIVGAATLVLYFVPTLVAFHEEVTTQENTDWASGAEMVIDNTEPGTLVLFEFMNGFPRYQPLFYGQPRYLPRSYPIRYPRLVVTAGHDIESESIAVLLAGPARLDVDPPDWRIIDDGNWRLLIPPSELSNDTLAVLQTLDDEITDDRFDVAIRLSLAIEFARTGNFEAARATLDAITPPDVADPQLRFESYWESARDQIEELAKSA